MNAVTPAPPAHSDHVADAGGEREPRRKQPPADINTTPQASNQPEQRPAADHGEDNGDRCGGCKGAR